jgi:ASC-1-like (ASCH) protein
MGMTTHQMKSWTQFFQAIKNGTKKHDLRRMDRDFKVGDMIILHEYDQFKGEYTGEQLDVKITFITSEDTPCAYSSAVLERGYCILSLEHIIESN